MVLSHVGEHKGDLLCCMPIEGAVETAPTFHTLNFPLKSCFFLHAAPPLTVYHAAAFLHPKDVQRYHSGVTLKPSPASFLPTDTWASDESPKSWSTQSNPVMLPSFCPWKLSSTIYPLVSCRSNSGCFYSSDRCRLWHGGSLGSPITAPFKG